MYTLTALTMVDALQLLQFQPQNACTYAFSDAYLLECASKIRYFSLLRPLIPLSNYCFNCNRKVTLRIFVCLTCGYSKSHLFLLCNKQVDTFFSAICLYWRRLKAVRKGQNIDTSDFAQQFVQMLKSVHLKFHPLLDEQKDNKKAFYGTRQW